MRAMESKRKKLEASEEKRFWRQVLLKCWRHQKHLTRSRSHMKHISSEVLKIIRSWRSSEAERIEASKGCSKDLITPIIAED